MFVSLRDSNRFENYVVIAESYYSLPALVGLFCLNQLMMAQDCFDASLIRVLSTHFGGITLKDKQYECIKYLYSGRDVVANLPTGYGNRYQLMLLCSLLPNCRERVMVALRIGVNGRVKAAVLPTV